jgi:hypothetical protein
MTALTRSTKITYRQYLALYLGQKQHQRAAKEWPTFNKPDISRGNSLLKVQAV